jgi:hypothetical protein
MCAGVVLLEGGVVENKRKRERDGAYPGGTSVRSRGESTTGLCEWLSLTVDSFCHYEQEGEFLMS